MAIEHGAKAAKTFISLIKQTTPQGDKPGRNRSIVVGTAGKANKPVILVSPKRPTNALTELKKISEKLGQVTALAIGQVVFEDNVVHLKSLKTPANEMKVKNTFLDYYHTYKVSPPSIKLKLWRPDEWEAAEFEEDPTDTGVDDNEGDEGDEADGDEADGDDTPSDAATESESTSKKSVPKLADYRARLDKTVESFQKSRDLVAASPQAQPFIKSAQEKIVDAARKFKAADYPGMEAALKDTAQFLVAAVKAHQGQAAVAQTTQAKVPQGAQGGELKARVLGIELDSPGAQGAQIPKGQPRTQGANDPIRAAVVRAAVTKKQTDEQKAQYDQMAPVLVEVTRTYFNPNAAAGSARLKKEPLKAGTHFKSYLSTLEELEKLKAGAGASPNAQLLVALKAAVEKVSKAAQAHLAHFEKDLSKSEKQDKIALRKKQICEEGWKAARHYAMALELQEIGAPPSGRPWSPEQQVKVNGLRAQFSFETGYKKAANLGGAGGASAAYWVESEPPGSTKATKNFIFKPMEGEAGPLNDEKGAGAAKESLASAKAKLFEQQTGIDLGVPETSVATIGGYAIDAADGGQDPKIGSIQQFAKTDGDLTDQPQRREILRQIDPRECQRMALNDLMALNVDRHAHNFLVQKGAGPNGSPRLVPIDHGCSLPSLQDFKSQAAAIGGIGHNGLTQKNVLLDMPGSYAKFSQDMQDRIALMDPDAIAAGAKDHLDALDKVNPGLGAAQKVRKESIELSMRVMKFLKKAAPTLSPAEIQIAVAQNKDIFADFNQDIEKVADQIIQIAAPKGPGYAEFFGMSDDQRKKMVEKLISNGWGKAPGQLAQAVVQALIMSDPLVALKLYKGDVKKGQDGAAIAATGVDTKAALTNSAQGLLTDVAKLLPKVEQARRAAFAQRHQQLSASSSPDESQAKTREDQARKLYDEVSDSCLELLAVKGKILGDNKNLLPENRREEFNLDYKEFRSAVGVRPSVEKAEQLFSKWEKEKSWAATLSQMQGQAAQ